ncbi:metalloendopeptidase OMA1, mitochondrial-like [Schistocerca nitens]|uniref:metalloendopeptidase OMA1, mitochondrial-like n=1 Tax=Schistocerca nitens TaxID=7011 RepID=UPI002117BCF2|nr:metalloendopeptidase OMA1, mitochondrial-like [Schistocerca nitens]
MVGLKLRHWWKNLTPNEKDIFFEAVKRNIVSVLISFVLLHSGFLMLYAYYLEFDPVTNRRKLVVFSDDQISEIAASEQRRIIKRHEVNILPTTHQLHQIIGKIVTKIVDSNDEIPNIRNKMWSIYVVDSPEIRNAFVLPNGAIFFFTGLLTVASNDDQTSIILSHEMAHTVLSHMAEQISNVHFHNLLFNLAIIVIWATMPILYAFPCQWLAEYLAKMFVELPFSRNLELEADKVGLILAAKACFDVREASLLWSKLKLLASLEGGLSTEPAEIFSTHPSYETRKRHLDSQLPAALKLREKCDCPRLPGNDPREFINIMLQDLEELQRNHKSIYIISKILGNQSK